MSRQIIISEINDILESLKEQQELIARETGPIPRIDTDIMMGNVRKLYEMLIMLQKEELKSPQQVVTEIQIAEPVVAEVRPEVVIAPTPAPVIEMKLPDVEISTREISEVVVAETKPEPVVLQQPEELLAVVETEVQAAVSEIKHEEELPRAAVAASRKKSFMATASLFDEAPSVGNGITAQPTVYDKISSASEDSSISRKMQSDPVSDLKKSIGINEKFSFINELFDGDLDSYNRAIEQLNTCDGLTSAIALLENTFSAQLGWNRQSNSFLNLMRLIERRYS